MSKENKIQRSVLPIPDEKPNPVKGCVSLASPDFRAPLGRHPEMYMTVYQCRHHRVVGENPDISTGERFRLCRPDPPDHARLHTHQRVLPKGTSATVHEPAAIKIERVRCHTHDSSHAAGLHESEKR